ncbi:hypothetical protein ABT369_30845 [Dactylosporangium sp. NPDC000244]|uniref:hypothetical protein n=1 Tax=Dactylosporangium sp. NPDC000244 TaxID=3154365 RepID=UPI003329C753
MSALNHRHIAAMGRRGDHPEWCAQGHRCGLGEHRAAPLTVEVPGLGAATLTRVQSADGREHAEVRLTVVLAADELTARVQLGGVVRDLKTVIARAAGVRRAA